MTVLVWLFVTLTDAALAQTLHPGSLDTSFAPQRITGASFWVLPILVESNGNIITGGSWDFVEGNPRKGIARLRPDGSCDPTFGADLNIDGGVTHLARMADGGLVIGGDFEFINGVSRRKLARLNPDGSFDPSFAPDVPDGLTYLRGLLVLSDGRILVAGFSQVLWALNPDGTPDPSFAVSVDGEVQSAVLQPDGKVVIAGYFSEVNGAPRSGVARLNPDSTLDETFTGADITPARVWCIERLPDGKLVIGGDFTQVDGAPRKGIARLEATGTLDPAFDAGDAVGGAAGDYVFSLTALPGGRVLAMGRFSEFNGVPRERIVRLEADGSVDVTFEPHPPAAWMALNAALQADGKILLGQFDSAHPLCRLETSGALDQTFSAALDSAGSVSTLALQADGGIVIGGVFSRVGGEDRKLLARLFADGTLDPGFDVGTGLEPWPRVDEVVVQPDGRILVGGSFWGFCGVTRNWIVRLESDGTLDTTFNDGEGPNEEVSAIALQPDGKVVIGGAFTSVDLVPRGRIARLDALGHLDPTFDPAKVVDGNVTDIALQADGRVLIAGGFSVVGGIERRTLARLNANGSLDPTFDAGITSGWVQRLAVLADGRILAVGSFALATAEGLVAARLNPDGSPDPSLQVEGDGYGQALMVQANGQSIVGGSFSQIGGQAARYLARLTGDGQVDGDFEAALGHQDWVRALALTDRGKILVGGDLETVDGVVSTGLARLHGVVQTLTVTKSGSGQGTVTADSGAIACGEVCSDTYGNGDHVTLSAAPGAGSLFVGWSGEGCGGTGTCTVVMDQARAVTAEFAACPLPAAPVLTAPGVAGSGVDYEVSWTATSPLGTYELQEATDAGFASPTTMVVSGTSQTRNHVASPMARYYTRARAQDSCGTQTVASSWSNVGVTVVRQPGAYASFYTLVPCRVVDTREATGPLGGPALVAGATRVFDVAGTCGIPAGAVSLSVNVTVTEAATAGYLGLYRGDIAWPGVSTINFAAGQTRANNAVVQMATDGSGGVAVRNGSAGTVHFILDVNGYFQ